MTTCAIIPESLFYLLLVLFNHFISQFVLNCIFYDNILCGATQKRYLLVSTWCEKHTVSVASFKRYLQSAFPNSHIKNWMYYFCVREVSSCTKMRQKLLKQGFFVLWTSGTIFNLRTCFLKTSFVCPIQLMQSISLVLEEKIKNYVYGLQYIRKCFTLYLKQVKYMLPCVNASHCLILRTNSITSKKVEKFWKGRIMFKHLMGY